MEKESYIKKLVGKVVSKIEMGSSTTYAIGLENNNPNFERSEIELSISFEDYFLNIYNPITIFPSEKELLDFVGLKVIFANENNMECELIFDSGFKIVIDLNPNVFYGPEAMSLVGPSNFIAVWN